jgi:hypothetical protein
VARNDYEANIIGVGKPGDAPSVSPLFLLTNIEVLQSYKPFSFLLDAVILGGIGVPNGVPRANPRKIPHVGAFVFPCM